MDKANINVECDPALKAEYEAVIQKKHYAGISEAIRDHMRKTVQEYKDGEAGQG
jgi:metal-responsive CopG/Arc/MetJ family transcriptional regulator